jgi:hypothetical protein
MALTWRIDRLTPVFFCLFLGMNAFSHLHLDNTAARKCAENLKSSLGIKRFDISLNRISLEGAHSLGTVLADQPRLASTLTSLSFSHNSLGSDGAAALARCLVRCKALTELNLDHNGIGPELPAEVLQLTSLKTLSLRQNKLETFPVHLLKLIPQLDLEGNPAYLEMYLQCEFEDEQEDANKRSARRKSLHSLSLAWAAWENLEMPRASQMMRQARKEALAAGGGRQECPSLVAKLDEVQVFAFCFRSML